MCGCVYLWVKLEEKLVSTEFELDAVRRQLQPQQHVTSSPDEKRHVTSSVDEQQDVTSSVDDGLTTHQLAFLQVAVVDHS